MRTLLTGASGYIGLHILQELLSDGHQVTAVVRAPERLGPLAQAAGVDVVVADLRQPEAIYAALPGHTACIHTALVWGEPGEEITAQDVAVTSGLFHAAGCAGVERAILISSAAVHRPFFGEMSEDDALSTTDIYGATKAAGELFLRAHCAQHGMTGVVLRPGPVVGPPAFAAGAFRSSHRIHTIVDAAMQGRPIDASEDDGRQFSPVSTVAQAVQLLTRAQNPLPTYLCVDRAVLTWAQVARMVVATTGSASEVTSTGTPGDRPLARFVPHRIESLLGHRVDATEAMVHHIRHLARPPLNPRPASGA